MVKIKEEERWGAILGVMQTDMDKTRAVLRTIVNEMSLDMSTIETRLRAEGLNPATDAEYQRYYQLKSLLGGLYVLLEGFDGVMSSTVIELLKEVDDGV